MCTYDIRREINPVHALGEQFWWKPEKDLKISRRGLIGCHRPKATQKEKCPFDRQHENPHEVILHGAWYWCDPISGYSYRKSQFSWSKDSSDRNYKFICDKYIHCEAAVCYMHDNQFAQVCFSWNILWIVPFINGQKLKSFHWQGSAVHSFA